jgi:uncharacterized protein YqgQ
MNSWFDVQQRMKNFGIIAYTGNRLDDIALVEIELDDMVEAQWIDREEFLKILMILRRERQKIESSTPGTSI